MADLSTKQDPLDLRDEKPHYVTNTSGTDSEDPDAQPQVGNDPQDTGLDGPDLKAPGLDEEKVRQAEAEGKGF